MPDHYDKLHVYYILEFQKQQPYYLVFIEHPQNSQIFGCHYFRQWGQGALL